MKLKMHTPDGSVIVESNLVTQFYPDFESGGEMTTIETVSATGETFSVKVKHSLMQVLEDAEERYEDMLRQARSFREAHDSASEIIRKLERNKPTVKLPTTRLWAGKIACYEESEVVAMLERAGINVAAAGKGEAS